MRRVKRSISATVSILLALALVFSPVCVLAESVPQDDGAQTEAAAEEPAGKTLMQAVFQDDGWSLDQTEITMGVNDTYVYLSANQAAIDYAESSDYSVVDIDYCDSWDVRLERKGGGEATITVWGKDGTSRICVVHSEYMPLKLNTASFTFGKQNPYSQYSFWMIDADPNITLKKVSSSNSKVAGAKIEYSCAVVTPKKTGSTTVTVKDSAGRTAKIQIKVDKSWRMESLKFSSYGGVWYEDKTATVSSKPGAKVTLKIAGKKLTKTVGKKGYVRFKLKKHYKLKTKYTITYKYDGLKYTQKGKVKSGVSVYLGTLWTCKKSVPITVYGAVKGDKIYVTISGKTYKHKITKSGTYSTTIWADSNLGYISSVQIKIKNKYKQNVYNDTKYIRWN